MTGVVLDGRLTFDKAISREPATTKSLAVKVAGDTDMLIASDFDAGNMLARALSFRTPHAHKAPRSPAHSHRQ